MKLAFGATITAETQNELTDSPIAVRPRMDHAISDGCLDDGIAAIAAGTIPQWVEFVQNRRV